MKQKCLFSYFCNIHTLIMKSTFILLGSLLCSITSVAQQVFKNDELTVSKLKDKTWVVETSDKTTMYIVEGDKRAMLIDTGTKCTALDEIVRKITSKPLDVVITHLHPDHAGNIHYFDSIYLHPADTVMMGEYHYEGKINYVAEGQVFDLGGTEIEVAWMPGHTPGSIVLLNRATGDCFSGDAFGSGQVWLQLEPHVPMTDYLQSCRRMRQLMEQDGIRYIWCGHYPYVKTYYDLGYICKMETLAQRLAAGDTEGTKPFRMPPSTHALGHSVYLSDGPVMIVYNADKIN